MASRLPEVHLRSTLPGHQKVFRIEKSISLETHSFCADTRPMFWGKAILVKNQPWLPGGHGSFSNEMPLAQDFTYEYLSTGHEIW